MDLGYSAVTPTCSTSDCINRAVYKVRLKCTGCPEGNQQRYRTLCKKDLASAVKGNTQCNLCDTRISVLGWEPCNKANGYDGDYVTPGIPVTAGGLGVPAYVFTASTTVKPKRIGDSRRAQVWEYLSCAYSRGFLDLSEFNERMDRATAARFEEDLNNMLADLPMEAYTPDVIVKAHDKMCDYSECTKAVRWGVGIGVSLVLILVICLGVCL